MNNRSRWQIADLIFSKLFFFVFLILNTLVAFAGPGVTTYQAKIIKPDGLPLEATSVNFKFSILDPSGSCVLYSENYSAVNMNATGGLISFSLGSGIKTYPASATTFSDVFSNVTANLSCDAGGPVSYSPAANDTRKIVMQFHDGSGWQTLPAMSINAVPYAMYASEAQKLSGLPTCNPGEALGYNGVSFSCEAISGGGVTSSTVIAALGYTPVPPGSLGSNNTLPTGSSNSYALGRNNSQTTGGGGSNDSLLLGFNNNIDNGGGGSNSGYIIGYNNKFNTFGGGSSEAFIFGSNNTVNYSGFVIGRGVSAPANNAIVIGNGYQTINVMDNNRVGIGTSSPVTALDVSGGVRVGFENAACDSTLAGTLRYNGASLEYCDGTAWSGFSGSVTSSTVVTALGYTPANSATLASTNSTLATVSSSVSTANANIAAVSSSVTTANATIASVSSTVYSVSATVSSLSSSVSTVTTSVTSLTSSLTALTATVSAIRSSQWVTSGSTINYTSGYVGVGTSAPRQILDVAPATGNSIIRATSTNATAALQLYRNTAGAYTGPVLWSNGTSLNFGYDSSENAGATLMTLKEYGALGIGTTNPTTILSAYQSNGSDAAIALTNASPGQGAYVTSVAQSNFSGFTATGIGASWFSGQYGSTNYVIGDLTNSKIPFTLAANAPTNSFYMTASGSVGIGGVAATAKLHLAAGTSTAGTAPLKFTSGTLTSSPEAGAVEYDGFNLYVTNGAGTRTQLGSGSGSVTSSSVISALGYAPVSSSAVSQWTTSGSAINYTSGNVGIGTSNPTKALTLSGVNIGMNLYDTTYATSLINLFNSGGNGNLEIFSGASSVIKFSAQNNIDSYFNSGANFGIGTTTPGARLTVKGAGATSATFALSVIDSSNNSLLSIRNDGVVSIGTSTRAGTLGINVTSPVYTLDVSGTNIARFSNVETGGARLVMTNGSTGGRSWTLASTGSTSTGGAGLFHIADYGLGNIFSFKNDGSFGVNVAIPLAPLHVASSTAYMLFEETDTTQKFYQGVDTSRYFIRQGSAANSDLLTVTNAGNVGIGNSSPSFPLDIWTTGSFNARYVHTSNNANDDAAFIMARQRGTVASPLAVQAGDAIGGFYFRPYDGTSMNNTTAYIEVGAAQNHTTSLRGNYMTFATTVSGTNTNQEIMRIHSNGYVGIGNSNPNNLLQVGPSGAQPNNYGIYVASYNNSAGQAQYTGNWANTDWWGIGPATNSGSDNTLRIGNISDRTGTWSGTQNLNLLTSNMTVGTLASGDDNSDYVVKSNGQLHLISNASGSSNTSYVHLVLEAGTATSSNSAVIMNTLGSERMRVNYNGNVGIGTTNPASKLDVNGYSATAGVGTVFLRNSYNSGGTKYWQIGPDGNGSGNFVVYNDGLAGAYIVYGQTTWSSSSDRRLKKEIQPIDDGLNKLLQLNGVTYHYNRDAASDPRKAGVIAQDVEKVLPEAITKDDNGFLSVKYTEIIPLVIEGVKQLYQNMQAEFSSQKRQMASIEEENSRLKEENTLIKNYLCAKDPDAPFCKVR